MIMIDSVERAHDSLQSEFNELRSQVEATQTSGPMDLKHPQVRSLMKFLVVAK